MDINDNNWLVVSDGQWAASGGVPSLLANLLAEDSKTYLAPVAFTQAWVFIIHYSQLMDYDGFWWIMIIRKSFSCCRVLPNSSSTGLLSFTIYTAQLIRGQTVLVNLQSFLLPMLCSDGIPEEMRGLRNWAALPSIHGVHHGAGWCRPVLCWFINCYIYHKP